MSDYYPHQWFARTLTDFISTMTLGTISTLSSALILLIIYKSPVQLRSTYHRIMTLLSCCDICFSVPFALATIPMPQSMIPYEGPTLGTEGTCIAQGMLLQFGAGAIHDTTLCLAGYYVCTALRVNHWKITRIYEPLFYAYIIGINLVGTVLTATKGYINIRHWTGHCGSSPIPSYCWYEESWMEMDDEMDDEMAIRNNDVDLSKCVWPEEPHHFFITSEIIWRYYILITWILLILAMLVVIIVVCRNERNMIQELRVVQDQQENDDVNNAVERSMEDENSNDGITNSNSNSNSGGGGNGRLKLEVTHLIIRQAIMYILAFFMTWGLSLIRQDESTPQIYDILDGFLYPLGGFWNMLIFVHIKILHVRASNVAIDSNFKAFMVLIKEPDTVPEMVLSGMENVQIADRILDVADLGYGYGDGDGDGGGGGDGGSDGDGDGDGDEEEGVVSEESSRVTSNPSAYDGLSMETPSDASHGLSGASQWDTNRIMNMNMNMNMNTNHEIHTTTASCKYSYYRRNVVETSSTTCTRSSPAQKPTTITVTHDSSSSSCKASEQSSSSRESITSDVSGKTTTSSSPIIANNDDDTKEVYKYYSEIATKFRVKVGLVSEQNANSEASPESVVMDGLSSTRTSTSTGGLSMGAPSYGGLSNEMPAIEEDDDDDDDDIDNDQDKK